MAAPRWKHRGIKYGYHKLVMVLVLASVVKDVVAGCVTAVTVVE